MAITYIGHPAQLSPVVEGSNYTGALIIDDCHPRIKPRIKVLDMARISLLSQARAMLALTFAAMHRLNPALSIEQAEYNSLREYGKSKPNKLSQKGKRKRARQSGVTVKAIYK